MNEGRILAIDFGERRIGIAVSDPLRITAQPLPTLMVTNQKNILATLKTLISEKNIKEIVVGMPYNLKGDKGVTAQKVEEFIQQLIESFQLPVHSWDERFTSVVAQRTLREFGKSPSRNRSKVDQVSALLILQAFLDRLGFNTKRLECGNMV